MDKRQSGQDREYLALIPYGRQEIAETDIDAVVEVLRSDYLTQGPVVPEFEKSVAAFVGASHAIAANSATSALHLACMAMEVGTGDILWTSPNTFVASANCALYCGAEVDFVDIDPDTFNMCPTALANKLERAAAQDRLPSVVVPVHMCGQSCNMREIASLARAYGFRVLEDASHAIGGRYGNQLIGSCEYSDIAVFSFHPVKIITTGEGGMALTNSPELAQRLRLLRTHGITREAAEMESPADGPWSYEQIELGFNYRMTDIQAALGLSQLARLEQYIERRHELAERYNRLLTNLPIKTPVLSQEGTSAFHLYVVRLQEADAGISKHDLFCALRERGIGVNVHYIPVHTQPYYRRLGFQLGDFPAAENYYREAMSLPLFPSMSFQQQDAVIEALRDLIGI